MLWLWMVACHCHCQRIFWSLLWKNWFRICPKTKTGIPEYIRNHLIIIESRVGTYKSGARLFILSFFNWKDIIKLWKKGVDYDENDPIYYRRTDSALHRPAIDFRRRFNGGDIFISCICFLRALLAVLAAAEEVAAVTTMDITGMVPVIRICKLRKKNSSYKVPHGDIRTHFV